MTGSPQNNAYLNKQRKMTQIRFHLKIPHTVTEMNDNINMDSTIAGSMNDSINMDSTIAGSMNDNINMDSTIAGSMNDNINHTCQLYRFTR